MGGGGRCVKEGEADSGAGELAAVRTRAGRARMRERERGGAVAPGRDAYVKLREVRPVHFSATSLMQPSVSFEQYL